ncbi:MAG: TonB-dependent receptor [Gammaproteobacteria bacterium]|nr:MAG: TonB-dependent receptor [Gammaproteobacteria bacterium]
MRLLPLYLILTFLTGNIVFASDDVIVLSASKVSVPGKEVGGSVTIITRDEIEKSNAVTLVELLRIVPGVTISQLGPYGSQTQVRIRGAEANHVLVLIDGVEANDPATGSEFNFANLLPDSIERIEVMRGAQSSVWGSDALAGIISIKTRIGYGEKSISSSTEVGSHNFIRSSASATGDLGRLKYYLQGSYLDTNGTNVSEQGTEDDGYDQTGIVFNSQYEFNPTLTFGLNARYVDSSNEFDSGSFGAPVDADNISDVEQFYGASFLYLSMFDNRWNQKFSISLTDTRNQNEDTFGNSRTEGEKLKLDYLSEVTFNTRVFSDEQHKVLLSIEQEDERFKQRGASSFGNPNQNQDIRNTGFAVEYRLSMWDQLFLSASLRKDDNDQFKDRDTVRFTSAYYFPRSGTKVRASYGTGVKNPSFGELFGFFEGSFMGNPNLKPEKSESWEFGIDQSFASDTAHVGTTFFWEDLKDEITTLFFPSTAVNLDGRSERNGAEFYFDAQINNRFDMRGAYTYTDSTTPNVNDVQIREIRRPKTVASLQFNYESLSGKGNLNAGFNYVDEQLDTDFSTFTEIKLDDYYLVNVNGSYNITENFNLYARINNLLDDTYQDVFGYETLGQTFYAGIKVNL